MKQVLLRLLVPALFAGTAWIAFQVHLRSQHARKQAREIETLTEKIEVSQKWEEREAAELAKLRAAVDGLDEKEYEAPIDFLRKRLEEKNLPAAREREIREALTNFQQARDQVLLQKEKVLKQMEKMEKQLKEAADQRAESERRLRELGSR